MSVSYKDSIPYLIYVVKHLIDKRMGLKVGAALKCYQMLDNDLQMWYNERNTREASMALKGTLFIRCQEETEEQVKARAGRLGVKYADVVRWALRWAINAPRDELLKYSVEAEQE